MDKINLWDKAPVFSEERPQNEFEPYINTYFVKNSPACMLICPGGGYEFLSDVLEGDDFAKWFNEKGISAAVLYYRIAPDYAGPHQLYDVKRAMRILRKKAKEEGYPEDKIGIIGFSAGAHLSAMASVHFEDEEKPEDDIDTYSSRPDFQVLCYPVITTDMSFAHQGSVINILSENLENEELCEFYSAEKQIKEDTPKAFIWHTAEDDCVPVKNSLVYAAALAEKNIPTELHIYPYGVHGAALAKDVFHTCHWTEDFEKWLFEIALK